MNSVERFRINVPNVAHEIIDGEAVIVNLSNGMYYSTDKSGVVIWDLIDKHCSTSQIVAQLTSQYTGEHDAIENAAMKFIARLAQEKLIVPDSEPLLSESLPQMQNPTHLDQAQFEEPQLHFYNDMEDLLLLDPVHESGNTV